MFCRLEMVLVRRFCEAPRFARVAPIDAIAASIAVIALSMFGDSGSAVAPVRTTVPLPTDRLTASNLELRVRSMLVGSTRVGTHLQGHGASRTVQQVFAVQVGGSRDTSHLVRHLSEFGVGRGLVSSTVGTVTCLNSQFTHTLQNVGRFLQSAFSGLSHRDTVVGVFNCNVLAADLAVIRLEICRPAASSLALLIFRPEDRRDIEVDRASEARFRFF